jgi:hypothetical protein
MAMYGFLRVRRCRLLFQPAYSVLDDSRFEIFLLFPGGILRGVSLIKRLIPAHLPFSYQPRDVRYIQEEIPIFD